MGIKEHIEPTPGELRLKQDVATLLEGQGYKEYVFIGIKPIVDSDGNRGVTVLGDIAIESSSVAASTLDAFLELFRDASEHRAHYWLAQALMAKSSEILADLEDRLAIFGDDEGGADEPA